MSKKIELNKKDEEVIKAAGNKNPEAGDKEVIKAMEDVMTRNIKAAIEYSNSTRVLVRDLEKEVINLKNLVVQYDNKIANLQTQISNLQIKLYQQGS